MTRDLNSDDTIREVIDRLADPEQYLINVILTMQPYKAIDPPVSVRIGVSGTGSKPYHLISYQDATGNLVHKSCDGQKTDTDWGIHPDSPEWSTRSMTLLQVNELLGDFRARTQKRAK